MAVVANYSANTPQLSTGLRTTALVKRRTYLNKCTVKLKRKKKQKTKNAHTHKKNCNHIPRRPVLILTWKNSLSHNYKLSTNCSFILFPFGSLTFLKTSQHSYSEMKWKLETIVSSVSSPESPYWSHVSVAEYSHQADTAQSSLNKRVLTCSLGICSGHCWASHIRLRCCTLRGRNHNPASRQHTLLTG